MKTAAASSTRTQIDVADLAMLATVLIWAANGVIVKAAIDQFDPVAYVFARFAIVVVVFFTVLKLRRTSLRIARKDWKALIICGVIGFALYNSLFTLGLAHTSAFSAALLVNTGPIFTLMLSAMLRIEVVRPIQWLGAFVALFGIVVFEADKMVGAGFVIGDLFALAAAVTWAMYTLAARPLVKSYGPSVSTAWSVLIGIIAITPYALPKALHEDWGVVNFGGWSALFYSAVFSMLVSYTIWNWAIARRGVARTAPFLFLIPILTGVFAVIFLGEEVHLLKIAGAVLVLAGIALARRSATVASPPPRVHPVPAIAQD